MKLKSLASFLFVFSALLTVKSSFAQYCLPTSGSLLYTNPCNIGSSNYIKNVSIAGTPLNNSTGCTANAGANACNVYAPSIPTCTANLQQGNIYNLSVTTSNQSIVSVWIDYNHNNTFDAAEWTQVSFASTTNVPSTVSITIPYSAVVGTTGMRIRSRDVGLPNGAADACTTGFLSGEMEQYTVTIVAAPACTTPPLAGITVSSLDTVCPTSQFTLRMQGASIAQGLTQQWQSSLNGTSWTTIPGATGTVLTTTQYQTTYYQCQVSCNGGAPVTSVPKQIIMRVPTYYNLWGVGNAFNEHFENWIDYCDNNDVPSIYWLNTPINGNESWRKQNEGFTTGGWSFPNGTFTLLPHTGNGAADFHSFSGNGFPGTLDLFLNCTNFSKIDLDFWYFKNQNGFDKFEVYLSRNGGFSWDDTLITLRNNTVGQYGLVWVNKIINNVSVNNSPYCVLRFKDFGDIFGTNDTGLDDLGISGILGTADVSDDNTQIAILPNPSNGKVEIRCRNKNFTKAEVHLLDMTGRIVASELIQSNNSSNWSQTMDWSSQAKGVYFVKLITDKKVYTHKIVIE